VAWEKPQRGFIKSIFDGCKSHCRVVGVFMICNWEGKFITAAAFNLGSPLVLVAEATTMRNAVQTAVQTG